MPKLPNTPNPWDEAKARGYTALPNEMLRHDLGLTPAAHRVLLYLMSWMDPRFPDKPVRKGKGPRQITMASDLNLTERGVRKALQELTDGGLIRCDSSQRRGPNSYVIVVSVVSTLLANDVRSAVDRNPSSGGHRNPSSGQTHRAPEPQFRSHRNPSSGLRGKNWEEPSSEGNNRTERATRFGDLTYLYGLTNELPKISDYPVMVYEAATMLSQDKRFYNKRYNIAASCCGAKLAKPGQGAFVPGIGNVCDSHYPVALCEFIFRQEASTEVAERHREDFTAAAARLPLSWNEQSAEMRLAYNFPLPDPQVATLDDER